MGEREDVAGDHHGVEREAAGEHGRLVAGPHVMAPDHQRDGADQQHRLDAPGQLGARRPGERREQDRRDARDQTEDAQVGDDLLHAQRLQCRRS
jgi:hypothetical protein